MSADARYVVAIDPGLTGAIAILSPGGNLECVADLPVIRDRQLAWVDGQALAAILISTLGCKPARAVVERVSAMPRQGVASSFNFGVGFGSVLAALQTRHLPIELITAAAWKRALGLSADKRASLDRARLLFPSADLGLAKHDGRAEALLLGYWALNRQKAVTA